MARKRFKIFDFGFKNSFKKHGPTIIGILFISIFLVWRYHNARILSFNTSTVSHEFVSSGIKPVYIKSYPLGIDTEIKDSAIVDGVWQIQLNSANYLVSSAGIGDNGNTIIYGHNKDNILGPLRWIKKGAEIEILASCNKYYYEVIDTHEVDPDNLQYILPTDSEILTIYTCTGFLDSKRFIAQAVLKN